MNKIRLLISLLFTMSISTAMAVETRHYVWLTNGVKSGSLVVTIDRDKRTRTTHFEFNDRGRGPKLTEVVQLGPDGEVAELEITGHSYMGASVEERFERSGEKVVWHSTLEDGSSQNTEAFYLANNGTPEQKAMLARAILSSGKQRIDLLPGGRARISKLHEYKRSGAGTFAVNGVSPNKSLVLSLYAISGIGMNPEFIWLDQNNELFGLISGSMGLVPAGWTHIDNQLRKQQKETEKFYFQKRSRQLTHEIDGDFAITNANVVDVEAGLILKNRNVIVSAGSISAVSTAVPEHGDMEIIDAKGGYLVPGLWDMHTHLSLEQGLLHLAGGVTTARDMGNNPDNYQSIRDSFDSGTIAGPRSYAAGVVEGKSPFSAPIKAQAESQEDAIELVRKYAGLGYPQIKIYSSVEPAWVGAIADEAHALGLRVSGHIPAFMTAEQAVREGFDEVQHINMLFLNFLAGPLDDTRTPLRFTQVAERASTLDLESPEVAAFLALLKEEDVVIDPTVAIFDNMFRHRSGQPSPSFAMVADHFPPAMRRGMLAGRMDINDTNASGYAASADAMLAMLRKLHENGIRIVAGTDSLPGFGLHRELELYQQAGIPAAKVLKLATLEAAQLMGAGETSGSIVVGKQADLVLLAANPLEDISAVRSTRMVFRGDRYFKPAQVFLALGIRPFD